jgi:hypothetical protein
LSDRRVNSVDWLLDSDPAIRWQSLRDLSDAPAEDVARERARVASEGWGAALLARQRPDGAFGGQDDSVGWDATNREWNTLLALLWLRDLGVDPTSDVVSAATKRTAENVTWKWWDNRPFFHGEVEPCINGRVLALAAYFGHESGGLVDRLLGEQMKDGGWNCEQENGSVRGSFDTTINERATGRSDAVAAAREKGEEYLLERRLLRRLSSGELVDTRFTELAFPTGYHYDVLRALDYFRQADRREERLEEALTLIEGKRSADGRWQLDVERPDQLDIGTGERANEPSRWITLRALRVLRWAGRA